MPVTLASICVSVSATRSAAGTLMLKTPRALTVPVTGEPLTIKVTMSLTANLPVTLPVMAMLPVFSALLMMLSAVTGSMLMAVWVGVGVLSTT